MLTGVRLSKMSESNIGYAPDASFQNEIVISGKLEVTSLRILPTKVTQLTDLIGATGLVEGEFVILCLR